MSRSSVRRQAAGVAAAGVLGLAAAVAPVHPASAAVPSSTTVVLSAAQSSFGQLVTASAAVTTPAGPAEGDVVFSVDGVAFKANLGASGTASLVLPRAAVGAHAVQATFLPRDPLRQDGSTSPSVAWQVVPVRTRLQVRVTGKRLRAPIAVHVRAAGDYGTTPSGQVRIVVRKSGRKVRVARGTLEGGAVGGRLLLDPGPSRRGRYRVQVTYRGDADHLAATREVRFRIGARR
ncbi:Ig-like domain-containing protein [Nocardioides sp.]|uniref:Ig-like domain-containing protein n=1 Tax=Nocardioides sp. TaxID=35761 RepID=UPI0035B01532